MKKLILTALTIAAAALFAARDSRAAAPTLEDWCVARMSSWSPPGRSLFKNAKETEEEGLARYRSVARDAISVAFDPSEQPLFPGPYGRAKTLATMLAIADSESGFRRDVDFGIGDQSKGDSGRSWCLMQIQLGAAVNGKTPKRVALKGDEVEFVYGKGGWGGEDLVTNRKACFRAALHIMRASFKRCSDLPVEERLAIYTSGSCDSGREASKTRIRKAIKWLADKAPPVADALALAAFSAPSSVPAASLAVNP